MFKVGDIIDEIFYYEGKQKSFIILEINEASNPDYDTAEIVEYNEYHSNGYIITCDYLYRYDLNVNLTRKHKLKKLLKYVQSR